MPKREDDRELKPRKTREGKINPNKGVGRKGGGLYITTEDNSAGKGTPIVFNFHAVWYLQYCFPYKHFPCDKHSSHRLQISTQKLSPMLQNIICLARKHGGNFQWTQKRHKIFFHTHTTAFSQTSTRPHQPLPPSPTGLTQTGLGSTKLASNPHPETGFTNESGSL